MRKFIFWIIPLLFFFGCSTADTNGPITERAYDAPIKIDSGGGDVILTVNLNASGETDSESTQSPANTATNSTDAQIPLAFRGATSGTGGQTNPQGTYTPDYSTIDNVTESLEKTEKLLDELQKANEENLNVLEKAGKGLDEITYQTRFHHTTTSPSGDGHKDDGKSLILCPGQNLMFDHCESSGVNIPYHGLDEGRIGYWAMTGDPPAGDIVCTKDGKSSSL